MAEPDRDDLTDRTDISWRRRLFDQALAGAAGDVAEAFETCRKVELWIRTGEGGQLALPAPVPAPPEKPRVQARRDEMRAVCRHLGADGKFRKPDVKARFPKVSVSTVASDLAALCEEGFLVRGGQTSASWFQLAAAAGGRPAPGPDDTDYIENPPNADPGMDAYRRGAARGGLKQNLPPGW